MRPYALMEEVQAVETVDAELWEQLLSCWVDVSNAGGAVGYVGQVTGDDVRPELSRCVDDVHDGRRQLLVLRDDGELVGFGFLMPNEMAQQSHWATVRALMVHPKHQGRGLGRVLLDGFADFARSQGLEFLVLAYRDGLGLDAFYGKLGYVEVGRLPGAIRVAPGDDRDGVEMMLGL